MIKFKIYYLTLSLNFEERFVIIFLQIGMQNLIQFLIQFMLGFMSYNIFVSI